MNMPWPWTAPDKSKTTTLAADPHHDAEGLSRQNASDKNPSTSTRANASSITNIDPLRFTPVQTIVACVATTVATLGALRLYKRYLRPIPNVGHIKPEDLRKRSIFGYVTSVGDADNFRLLHTPGGRLTGWGWLPSRRITDDRKSLKDRTVHVRIAGVDAPELAHFGRPAQPHSQEALDWLQGQILHSYVRAMPYRKDQYERVVCSVVQRKWLFFKRDLGLEMLKAGYATVYEAKFGSEFGGLEEQYRAAEERAKQRKVGMWQQSGMLDKIMGRKQNVESPRQYKERMKKEDMAR